MTIDSGWVKILKTGAPDAFTRGAPFRPSVVFIDGQIKLMAPQSIRTWDAFFERQFLHTVEAQFDTGAGVVVLGFDNYEHVPVAKAPTQRKRNTHVPTVSFEEEDELPRVPPECMGGAMRNRTFKSRVIAFVVRRMRQHFKHEQHRTVVIDYQQQPEVLGRQISLPSTFATDTHRRGECDVKAFAWAELGSLLIVSTDGDFVPLSLLHLDRQPQHQVALLRMTTNVATAAKRSSAGAVRRTYEHVHMRSLQHYIAGEMPDLQHAGTLFAVWCMLTGCDFAANLPGLGPTKVWQCRQQLQHCAPTEAGLMHALCLLYLSLFKTKLGGAVLNEQVRRLSTDTAHDLFTGIHQSVQRGLSFAPRTKQSFWSAARAQVHVRNVVWTLEYWQTQHDYPDPVQAKYGYERKNNTVLIASH
jgi:hypothetical protein